MHVHFIVHEAFEAPGAIENWARQRADKVTYSRVYLGELLPTSVDTIDFLIVMGGHNRLQQRNLNVLILILRLNKKLFY